MISFLFYFLVLRKQLQNQMKFSTSQITQEMLYLFLTNYRLLLQSFIIGVLSLYFGLLF